MKNCLFCGKEFLPTSGKQKFCTDACKMKAQRVKKKVVAKLNPEIQPARFPGMTHKESGDKLLKLLEEIPGLVPASQIPVRESPVFAVAGKSAYDSNKLSLNIQDEAGQWKGVNESENELIGKALLVAAKKHKQDPYEFINWADDNFGIKPKRVVKETETGSSAPAHETYFQKRQREKNGIKL